MNIIILTLFSYIFNPAVSEAEKTQIIKKFNISFTLKRTPKVKLNEEEIIKLYNKGKYKEYIDIFEEKSPKFIYTEKNKIDYNKLYLYYTISLKILGQQQKYKEALCSIKGNLRNFKDVPAFVINEAPRNCSFIHEIKINNNANIDLYINGLKASSELFYTQKPFYNLTICKENSCKYMHVKESSLDKKKYAEYFNWKIVKGLFIAQTIPASFFQYYNVKKVHYFYKKDGNIFHKIKANDGTIERDQQLVLENTLNNNEQLTNKDTHSTSTPIYKKWYFYVSIVAVVGLTAGGIYWLQKDSGTNTTITWE